MPIDSISGPFCEDLSIEYIAHETDTLAVPNPLIVEDDSDDFIVPENYGTGLYGTECIEGQEICCVEPTVIHFTNQLFSDITYTPSLYLQHGNSPTVWVYYYLGLEGFQILGALSRISIYGQPVPTRIYVDHGGLATGIIKIV